MKQLRFKRCYTAEDVCKFANTSGVTISSIVYGGADFVVFYMEA